MRNKVFADASNTKDIAKYAVLKSIFGSDDEIGERQIRVVASTPTPDRVKDVMVPDGCDLTNYKKNPIVLADHNPSQPIGTADVEVKNNRVEALITFAPEGASQKADEYCALAKAGVLNTVSVGFTPTSAEPIKGGGYSIDKWELMELSLVAVPCNPDAVVVQRSLEKAQKAANWKVGASLNLPVDENDGWDGEAAEKSIFEACGFDGDKPDANLARKGFLVYDASAPSLKGSYKLPFARMVDGRLHAFKGGLRAAASRLPQADITEEAMTKARSVIDHYENKEGDKSLPEIIERKAMPGLSKEHADIIRKVTDKMESFHKKTIDRHHDFMKEAYGELIKMLMPAMDNDGDAPDKEPDNDEAPAEKPKSADYEARLREIEILGLKATRF